MTNSTATPQDNSKIIGDNSQVILHFDLTLEDGTAADSTRVSNKPAKMVMGDGSLTPNFEECLRGLTVADKKSFTLKPTDAFGMPNPDNIYYIDKTKFTADMELSEGMIMGFSQPDGSELPGIIRSIAGHSVTVDFNHPLAGQTVVFAVEIIDVK
ncbi:FKBP-type 16 kDa peptidyl-prolyl cis-trans isomerase [Glaciecola punicea ACAM 611]|jgi:FKBP-type peptidyl-prolyl cis-trans isomerase SlpA|uniref:Peptidyl-prolyl cis-trans isomerase n=1 Tax=Glaciecola punicea ACAM 611 TaxID=1121923 RepID=H5T807_9ALTE|nr:FKBP-type peptidyl-prolyl cis-trans isomerase [Glaciecola punicea]OFA30636.1 peptidylprolyl isomerase [Glaciecola punicea]GAB54434.1 FKBP-type 16 kDa peptidyl-prolyl cis-trans isomerase [Glaciecola punicea ACAM 611]